MFLFFQGSSFHTVCNLCPQEAPQIHEMIFHQVAYKNATCIYSTHSLYSNAGLTSSDSELFFHLNAKCQAKDKIVHVLFLKTFGMTRPVIEPITSGSQGRCSTELPVWSLLSIKWVHLMTWWCVKILNRMTNNADPPQTAPGSSLIWVYTVCSDTPCLSWETNKNLFVTLNHSMKSYITIKDLLPVLFTPPLFQNMWPCVQLLCAERNAPCQRDLAIDKAREWKLLAINPHDRHTWRSGVRSAMRAASQLSGRGSHWCGCCPCTCTLIKNPIMKCYMTMPQIKQQKTTSHYAHNA